MHRIYKVLLVLAAVAVGIAALPYSLRVHEAVLAATGFASLCVMTRSIRKYKPENPSIWWGLFAAASCFTTSFVLRVLFPDQVGPVPSGVPHITDYFDMSAFVFSIITLHRVGRLRDDNSDPTTIIDSVILAGGASTVVWLTKLLPLFNDPTLAISGKRWAVVMTVLSIGLAFCTTRIILTSSQKSVSSTRLGWAAMLAVSAEASTLSPSRDISTLLCTFGIFAFICLALSAVHPTMVQLSANPVHTRDLSRFGRITLNRIVFMTVSLLIAPIALLWKLIESQLNPIIAGCLILSWAVVTIFVMARIAGLMRTREHIAHAERTLSSAASSFVIASDVEGTYDAALKAMLGLSGQSREDRLALIALRRDDQWVVVDAVGTDSSTALGATLDILAVSGALSGTLEPRAQLAEQFAPYAVDPDTMVAIAPLVAHDHVRGLLMLFSVTPLRPVVASSINTLADSVSLALDAAALAENMLEQRSAHRFRALVENSNDLIFVVDGELGTSFASPSVERLLANSPAADFANLLAVMQQNDRPAVTDLLRNASAARTVEFRIDGIDDEPTQWFEATVNDLQHDEQLKGFVFNARNVSERKRLEEDLRHKVLHDNLTGIANRVLFRDRLDHALSLRRDDDSALVAVLFIDIDDFKTVNDGLGHDMGDELLKILALRLEMFTRQGDTAARLGGDEFAMLFEGFHTVEDVMAAANRLLDIIVQPAVFGDRELDVSASIGVAIADTNAGETSEIVLRNADVAMYHSKQTGKNRIKLFDQAMYISAFERLELKNELTHALERNELFLEYQPIFRLADSKVIGFEALMRWSHPTLGNVPPGSFIPLAEESGLIKSLGAWTLQEGTRQLAEWRSRFGVEIFISVNVSPRQLEDDGIVTCVRHAISASGIDPSSLTLELTESAGLDTPESRRRLAQLREMNCSIAADDFGTGFASYAALQQLPFTTVKIDRSLIKGLANGDNRAIEQVRSIIQMGHGIGLLVTAEGIEDEVQRQTLVELQADCGQGYGLGRPGSRQAAEAHMGRAGQLI